MPARLAPHQHAVAGAERAPGRWQIVGHLRDLIMRSRLEAEAGGIWSCA
jgi:hypothetical protein